MTMVVHGFAAVAFAGSMIYAAISDLRTFLIPNWISIVIVLAFVPAALAKGFDGMAVLRHLAAGAAMLAVGFVLALRWIGGGDAKLLAASAVWVGASDLLIYAFTVAVVGAVVTLLLIGFRRSPLSGRLGARPWVRRLHSRSEGVPYGVAIAVATLIVVPRLPIVGWA